MMGGLNPALNTLCDVVSSRPAPALVARLLPTEPPASGTPARRWDRSTESWRDHRASLRASPDTEFETEYRFFQDLAHETRNMNERT